MIQGQIKKKEMIDNHIRIYGCIGVMPQNQLYYIHDLDLQSMRDQVGIPKIDKEIEIGKMMNYVF